MTSLPVTELSYRPLQDLAMGPMKAAFLNMALELSIFDRLITPASAEAVARQLDTHPANTRRLLDGLATLDLVDKKEGHYTNAPLAATFLVTHSPQCIAPLLTQVQNPRINPLEALQTLIKKGPKAMEDSLDMADESLWAEEVKASSGWLLGGVGGMVSEIIKKQPGFSEWRTMLDMGCGHGVFSLYILEKNPELRGVLMDREGVLRVTETIIKSYGGKERISYQPGDYLTDDLGKGYDLIFASATLNFARGCLDTMLEKIHGALNPGGCFISFQDGLTHEQTKPDTMFGSIIPCMMMDLDYCFDQGEIADAAIRAGFQNVRSKTLATPIGEMELDIARKA